MSAIMITGAFIIPIPSQCFFAMFFICFWLLRWPGLPLRVANLRDCLPPDSWKVCGGCCLPASLPESSSESEVEFSRQHTGEIRNSGRMSALFIPWHNIKTTSEIRNIIYRKSMRKILNNLCKTAGCAIGNLSWVKRYMFSAPHGRSAVFSSGRRMGRLSKPLGAAVCKTHAVFWISVMIRKRNPPFYVQFSSLNIVSERFSAPLQYKTQYLPMTRFWKMNIRRQTYQMPETSSVKEI